VIDLGGRVNTEGALEGVPGIDVSDVRLGNVGAIQEDVDRSGQQVIIAGVLHRALFESISASASCVIDQTTHLEVGDSGLAWGCNVRHSGFQWETGDQNLMRLTVGRDGSFPLDSVSDRQGALTDDASRCGKALLVLHHIPHLDRGTMREPPRHRDGPPLRVFRGGLDGETLGGRDSGVENISSGSAKDKIGVVPNFTSRLSQSDAILEGDRGRRFPVLRAGVKIVNRVPLGIRNAWLLIRFRYQR